MVLHLKFCFFGGIQRYFNRSGCLYRCSTENPMLYYSLMVRLLLGIYLLGKKGIAHNDISLQNILIDSCEQEVSIYNIEDEDIQLRVPTFHVVPVISDFGDATSWDANPAEVLEHAIPGNVFCNFYDDYGNLMVRTEANPKHLFNDKLPVGQRTPVSVVKEKLLEMYELLLQSQPASETKGVSERSFFM